MVQINYAKLNDKMQRYATGKCEGDLEGFSETDLSALVKNNKPPEFISFDGNGIDLNDRNKKFYESGDYAGYISSEVSDENCNLSGAEIYISYKGVVLDNLDLSQGITFSFYGDCCREMYIQYINSNTETFWEENIAVNSDLFVLKPADTLVSSATALRITFTKTTLPNQFLKLSYVKFGTVTALKRIKNINLLEEINVLSDDLPINSLEYTVVLDEPIEFQDDDLMGVYSNGKYYGTFYLDEAERISQKVYNIKALNCLSILDKCDYDDWHGTMDLSYFIDVVKSKTGVTISETSGRPYFTFGYIPINTCRFALCACCFALGFMVDGSRNDSIELIKIPSKITSIIKTSDKRIIGEATYHKSKAITAANVHKVNNVIYNQTSLEYKKSGKYYFSESPIEISSSDTSGVVLEEHSLNFIRFSMDDSIGSATFSGHKLEFTADNYKIVNPNVTNEKTNEINLNDFLIVGRVLISTGIGETPYVYADISRDRQILKYIQSGGTVKAKIRLRGERVGDLIQIETAFDGMKTGIITSMYNSFGYEDVADIEVLEWNL